MQALQPFVQRRGQLLKPADGRLRKGLVLLLGVLLGN